MRITEAEQESRKLRMLYSAYDLFCEYGIDNVSIAQIAKSAGVSSNSIFRYFNNKAELVQSTQAILWQELTINVLDSTKTIRLKAKNGFEELKILLNNFKGLYEEHSKYLLFAYDYKLTLLRNNIKLSEDMYKKMMSPVVATFFSALERGHTDGSISARESVDTQFLILWGVMRGFVEEIVVYDKIYSGQNPWKRHFDTMLFHTLKILNANT